MDRNLVTFQDIVDTRDALDLYVERLTLTRLPISLAAAARARFLKLGSILASQAASISDLSHRLTDVESLAHSHPRIAPPPDPQPTMADLLEALNAINATLRRIEKRGIPKAK